MYLVTSLETRMTAAETKITALESKALNTGASLSQICNRIDFLYSTQATVYHCCANPDVNLMVCAKESFINAGAIAITAGTAGQCLSTDGACAG